MPVHKNTAAEIVKISWWFISALIVMLQAGCASLSTHESVIAGPCENEFAVLDADFTGGGMYSCSVGKAQSFVVNIKPEDPPPINPSPWYAFRLTPKAAGKVTVAIMYDGAEHRYWPKLTHPGKSIRRLNKDEVKSLGKKRVRLEMALEAEPIIISGQEIFTNNNYLNWEEKLAAQSRVDYVTIGQSVEGRPIKLLFGRAPEKAKTVVLVGRQHPPEITGALAMRTFVETVFAQTELATKFGENFNVAVVSNMNPDGVEHGHWRHNMNATDLNRDWGPFAQPETQSIKRFLDKIDGLGLKPVVFLDFHSTRRNVFYTQTVEDESTSYDFTGNWIANSHARLPNYEVERAERHNSDLATSKNYINTRYDIPAITYELGDETERNLINLSAQTFAEEMMKLLLTHETESSE